MSFIAFLTDRFDESVRFYGELLGFPTVAHWDRSDSRGRRFDLGGLKLELLDHGREHRQLDLGMVSDRVQVVVEVDDLEVVRSRISFETPEPQFTSWGAKIFQIRDPDGVPVTFLQWMKKEAS
jgi:catechol 2,3-dioxygenase-like lactoylglutathione lyase family enzyme